MRKALFALAAAAMAGCVERWLVIRSDPPGAQVYLDGVMVGETPYMTKFDFYGDREITLRMPEPKSATEKSVAFQTFRRVESISAPWWQIFPFDFVTDVALPFPMEDRREFGYVLLPLGPAEPAEKVMERARDLKRKLDEKK